MATPDTDQIPLSDQPIEKPQPDEEAPGQAATGSGSPVDASGGSASGTGFETMLGRIVVERGLVSPHELEDARRRKELDPGGSLVSTLVRAQ